MPQQRGVNFLGVGLETTKGTPVAAVDFIPFKTFEPFDNPKYLEDLGVRGSAVDAYGQVQGPIWSDTPLGGDLFPESFPRLALSLLGDMTQTGTAGAKSGTLAALAVGATTGVYTLVGGTAPIVGDVIQIDTGAIAELRTLTVVGGGGPYNLTWATGLSFAHAGGAAAANATAPFSTQFSINNAGDTQGRALTFTDFNGFNTRQWPGQQISELAIKFSKDGLLEWSGKALGFPSVVGSKPVASFNANPPVATWTGGLTLGGVSNAKLESGEVTIIRPTVVENNIAGSQNPYKIWQGDVAVTGKMSLFYEDDTDLVRYLTNTQPVMVFTFTTGSGPTQRQFSITCSKPGFKEPSKVLRPQGALKLEMSFKAYGNLTDAGGSGGYSPVRLGFQSAVSRFDT